MAKACTATKTFPLGEHHEAEMPCQRLAPHPQHLHTTIEHHPDGSTITYEWPITEAEDKAWNADG